MPAFVFNQGLLLVKLVDAPADRPTAKVTSATGWTDLSHVVRQFTINTSVEVRRSSAWNQPTFKGVSAGAAEGSGTIVCDFTPGDTADATKFFWGVFKHVDRKFSFVVQPDLAALTSGGTVTPAPTAANPQLAGSAVITGNEPFTTGDDLSTITVQMALDNNTDYYTS